MNSLLLRSGARIVVPIVYFLSVFLFLRGHNEPGGGFVGGLMAALAVVLHALAYGNEPALKMMRVAPVRLMAAGLLIAGLSGLPSLFNGNPFMTGIWGGSVWLPLVGKLKIGTVFFFDLGVFVLVYGALTKVVLTLLETD